MNNEEIEELKEFTIDLTDIDELALGLEVCSKKSNMVIQEFIDTIIQLQQENQELKKQNETIQEKFKEWKKDIQKERKFYLCERDCGFRLKESKKYLSYTQQIEKLKQENQELKEQIEEKNKPQIFIDTQDIEERYAEGLYQDYLEEENKKYKNQQKEFIEWLTNEMNINPYDISDYTYGNIIDAILSKYNEIIGSDSK